MITLKDINHGIPMIIYQSIDAKGLYGVDETIKHQRVSPQALIPQDSKGTAQGDNFPAKSNFLILILRKSRRF